MATSVEARPPLRSMWCAETQLENLFISISGLVGESSRRHFTGSDARVFVQIGAGKSTLAAALGKVLDLPVHYEPVIDNTYLADFYNDQKKYSFPLQIWLLNRRFRQQQQIVWEGKGGVQDRTIYEDTVFAKMLRDSGLMEERDYQTYAALFQNMSNFMKKPNVIVHLDVSPEESMERIKLRSRSCESSIPLEYLCSLHKAYEEFIAEISRVIPVIRVDYSRFRSAEEMAEMIKREYLALTNIRQVTWNPVSPAPSDSTAASPAKDPSESRVSPEHSPR